MSNWYHFLMCFSGKNLTKTEKIIEPRKTRDIYVDLQASRLSRLGLANLRTIPEIKKRKPCPFGSYSKDHI